MLVASLVGLGEVQGSEIDQQCVKGHVMKVTTYNIFEGGGDKERLERLASWMVQNCFSTDNNSIDLGVVAMNECNGWDTEWRLNHFLGHCRNIHHVLMPCRTGYHIGFLSQKPIRVVSMITEEPFHHGLLHVEVEGIHFLVCHLSPRDSLTRLKECEEIIRIARGLSEDGVPLVLLGDLNSLSPRDAQHHGELVQRFRGDQRLARKFLRVANGTEFLDYRPIELLESSLTDMYLGVGAEEESDCSEQATVPTRIHTDDMHAAKMRLDYILVNSILASKTLHASKAAPVRDRETDWLSDHYPVSCTLTFHRPLETTMSNACSVKV